MQKKLLKYCFPQVGNQLAWLSGLFPVFNSFPCMWPVLILELSGYNSYIFTHLRKGLGHKFLHRYTVTHTNSTDPGMFLVCPFSPIPSSAQSGLGVSKSQKPLTGRSRDQPSCSGGREFGCMDTSCVIPLVIRSREWHCPSGFTSTHIA